MGADQPDQSLYKVFGFGDEEPTRLLRGIAGLLPVAERSAVWMRLLRERGFWDRKDAVRLLFPTWLLRRLQQR